jgi:TP901 family phage tail tape measure protein
MAEKELKLKIIVDNTGAIKGIGDMKDKVQDTNKEFQTFSQKASKVFNKVKDNIKGSFLGITAGIAATSVMMKKTIGVAVAFEKAIANVASVSGDATEDLEKLARTAGETTVFSAREAADAMYFMASAGLRVNDMSKVLNPTLNLAAAAQMDIASATDLVVNQLKVFQVEMSRAGNFTDIMAKTVSSSNTNMQQLGNALGYAGGIANTMGVSFEELNTIIASLANLGVKGERAGTQLRMAFSKLINPTKGAEKALEKYGLSITDIRKLLPTPIKLFQRLSDANIDQADALEILGTRQTDIFALIKNGIPDLQKMEASINDNAGAAQEMADVQLNTLDGSIRLLKSAFQELIISGSGDGGLRDMFRSIVDIATAVIRHFNALPAPIKGITLAITVLTPAVLALNAALGPIGLTIIGLTAGFTALAAVINKSVTKPLKDSILESERLRKEFGVLVDDLKEMKKEIDNVFDGPILVGDKVMDAEKANLLKLQGLHKKISDKILEEQRKINNAGFIDLNTNHQQRLNAIKEYQEQLSQIEQKLAKIRNKDAIDNETDKNEKLKNEREKELKFIEELSKRKEKLLDKSLDSNQIELDSIQKIINNKELLLKENAITEEEITQLLQRETEIRNEIRRQEFEKAIGFSEQLLDSSVQLFDSMSQIYANYLDNNLDTTNEYYEALAAMDEEDRERQQQKLQEEIDTLLLSSSAADQELAKEKQRELDRMKLEDQAAARDKEIKVKQAENARKVAVMERVAANFRIVADTGIAIMKAIAASPQTLGQPWVTLISGAGLAQALAVNTQPLPEIPKFKDGGQLPGYGGGDKIPALLEPGEYIARKEAVGFYGKDFFERINAMKFQTGGYVPGTSTTTTTESFDNRQYNVTVKADDPIQFVNKMKRRFGEGVFK